MRNTQLLTVKLYTKQRDVNINPINASDTTVNSLRTELHIHTQYTHKFTHIYRYVYVRYSHKHKWELPGTEITMLYTHYEFDVTPS